MKNAKILGHRHSKQNLRQTKKQNWKSSHTCVNKMHSVMWNVLPTYKRMRGFILIPIYFPESDPSGAKLKYYLFVKSIKKAQIRFFLAILPRCARLSWKKLVTGLSTVCTSGSTYKLEM